MAGSLLKSTENTRPILPGSLRYLRSDVPARLTQEEIDWLRANNVTTIVDLRTQDEREEKPCPLAHCEGFCCLSMPVTGGNAIPRMPEDVPQSYIAMADAQMERIIDAICAAESNVLYFCSAGKDRTGVVSAILLKKAGMDDAYIIEDYMLSAKNLGDMLRAYAAKAPDVDIDVITPQRQYMETFMKWLNASKNFLRRKKNEDRSVHA